VARNARGASVSDADLREVDVDDRGGLGWLMFAGTLLGFAGVMRVIDAIWAFGYKGSLPDSLRDGVLGSNLKTYAWTWLIVGAIMIIASLSLLVGSQFGRWIGIAAAAIAGLSAATWLPYYPVWSVIYIAMAVVVFYALTRYGGRD
jgi:hypothetical protein